MKGYNSCKFFSLGPTESFNGMNSLHSRDKGFIDKLNIVHNLLLKTTFSSNDSRVITLSASGSGAMEASVISLFDNKSKVLILNSGTFGNRFVEICKFNNISYEEIKVNNRSITKSDLEVFENMSFDGILAQMDETSTGILHDMKLIGDFAKRKDILFVCDAISSYLCDYYNASEFNIDVTILSSQKALALPIGASFVILDKKAQERLKNPNSFYLNLKEYLVDELSVHNLRMSVPTFILELAYKRLIDIDKKGVLEEIKRVESLANHFRIEISKLDEFELVIKDMSNAMSYVRFKLNKAQELHERLLKEYNIFISPFRDGFIKVGHIGNLSIKDNEILIEAIKTIIKDMKGQI